MRSVLLLVAVGSLVMAAEEIFFYNGGKKIILHPIDSEKIATRGAAMRRHYLDEKGREVVIGPGLLVKCRPGCDLQTYLTRFRLKYLKSFAAGGLHLLEAATPEAAIEAANALHEMPDVLFAQPDIARKRMLR